jgi:hypothetical protein
MAHYDWSKPVSSLLNKLQQNGFIIAAVNDGEETFKMDLKKSNLANRKEATDVITSVDESWVQVKKGDAKGRMFIVLGNEPEELVCDYTDWNDLEMVITEHSIQWEGKKCPMIAD